MRQRQRHKETERDWERQRDTDIETASHRRCLHHPLKSMKIYNRAPDEVRIFVKNLSHFLYLPSVPYVVTTHWNCLFITFSLFTIQTHVVTTHWNRLEETISMSGHNIGFGGQIKKMLQIFHENTYLIWSSDIIIIMSPELTHKHPRPPFPLLQVLMAAFSCKHK